MRKLLTFGLIGISLIVGSANAQLSDINDPTSNWSPYDTIHCLGLECGQDVLNNEQLHFSIDFFHLDYNMTHGGDVYNGLSNWHHRTQEEIQKCTATCYGHYQQGYKACTSENPGDSTVYGRLSGSPDQASLDVCLKAVRDALYSCIPGCNN